MTEEYNSTVYGCVFQEPINSDTLSLYDIDINVDIEMVSLCVLLLTVSLSHDNTGGGEDRLSRERKKADRIRFPPPGLCEDSVTGSCQLVHLMLGNFRGRNFAFHKNISQRILDLHPETLQQFQQQRRRYCFTITQMGWVISVKGN